MREGDVVAGWTLTERLGEGGTATVWRVVSGDRRAVLKVLRAELRGEADWRARLLREADALRAVKHENVVALLDAGTADSGEPFVIMPEIAGETLRVRLDREKKLAPHDAWVALRPIAEALVAAHDAGIIHRDVKPDNVVLGVPAKLVDFGLARGENVPKVTATGAPIGTPAYMAPEQWWNKDVGPPVDQYALGVTLYETIAGRTPFDDASYAELVSSHVSKPAPRLKPDDAIAAFVARLLEKNPAARFPSMKDAIAAGDEAFGFTSPPPRVRFSPASVFFAAYGILLLVLFGYPRATSLGEWFRGAGFGIYFTLASFALGTVWVTLRIGARSRAALITAASGTFGAASGFAVVFRALDHVAPEEAFVILHQGAWEAQANRYVGFTLAAALCFAAEVRRTKSPTARRRLASMGTLAVACVCVTLGAPSAAMTLSALAFAFVLPESIGTLAGVALTAVAAITRAQALADAAWSLEPTRAARANALASAFQDRTIAFVAAAIAVATAVIITRAAWRGARSWSRAWLAFATVFALADAALVTRTAAEKRAIYTHLEPEFALLSQLDPPTTAEGHTSAIPPLRPTLKIARDRVALDSTPAILLSALDTDAAVSVLRSDLAHRIASEPARPGGVDLLVMADASAAPHAVTTCLRAAHDVGVRRVGILFLRGAPLDKSRALPEEAAYVLPRDFDMLDVRVENAGAPLSGATFADATRALVQDDVIDVR